MHTVESYVSDGTEAELYYVDSEGKWLKIATMWENKRGDYQGAIDSSVEILEFD